MSLSTHVSLTISQDALGFARAGYGKPMILSYTAAWAERRRLYTDLLGVLDDFPADGPEALAASAMFSQDPCPEEIMIGRGALKPTMRYSLSMTAANSTDYAIAVSGPSITSTDVEVTSDAAATRAELHSSFLTGLNAVTGKNYTAAFTALVYADDTFTAAASDICTNVAHGLLTGDGPFQLTSSGTLPAGLALATNYWIVKLDTDTFSFATSLANALAGTVVNITDAGSGTHTISDTVSTARPDDPLLVTGDAAGNWFSLAPSTTLIAVELTHADPGIATDLAAITNEDPEWYALCTLYNSQALVEAAAAVIQAQDRIYIFDVPETAAITTSGGAGGTADTLDSMATEEYNRVAGAYHPDPSQMFAAAWMGLVLPEDPGSESWKWKQPVGVTPVTLTATHETNLRARSANTIQLLSGRNVTWEGTTADGDFIDVRRGLDWLKNDMQTAVANVLASVKKVPFTDAGIAMIESAVRASLKRAVAFGIITDDFTISVPRASAVSSANKGIRLLPDIRWQATLQGAVHNIQINGRVSV